MMKFNLLLSVGVLAAVLGNARAFTKEDAENFEKDIVEHLTKCTEKFSITLDDLKEAKEKKNIDGVDPCFFACFFKSMGVINDEGKYDHKNSIDQVMKYISSDEDKEKITDIVTDCAKVNDETVSDGAEGCEISKKLMECFSKHKEDLIPSRR